MYRESNIEELLNKYIDPTVQIMKKHNIRIISSPKIWKPIGPLKDIRIAKSTSRLGKSIKITHDGLMYSSLNQSKRVLRLNKSTFKKVDVTLKNLELKQLKSRRDSIIKDKTRCNFFKERSRKMFDSILIGINIRTS